jgi:hypothetical protein
MTTQHPSLEGATVDAVVYQAVAELVSCVDDPDRLARLLDRRVHARLLALAGQPIAITACRSHG